MTETTENKTQHLHILMAPSEVKAIDDWGFSNRIRTRGEAIRRLCQMGLAVDGELGELVEISTEVHRAMAHYAEASIAFEQQPLDENCAEAFRAATQRLIESHNRLGRVVKTLAAKSIFLSGIEDYDVALAAAEEAGETIREFHREQQRRIEQDYGPNMGM